MRVLYWYIWTLIRLTHAIIYTIRIHLSNSSKINSHFEWSIFRMKIVEEDKRCEEQMNGPTHINGEGRFTNDKKAKSSGWYFFKYTTWQKTQPPELVILILTIYTIWNLNPNFLSRWVQWNIPPSRLVHL